MPIGTDLQRCSFDQQARESIRHSLGIGPDTVVVGAVERLVVRKQFDLLVRSCAPLVRQGFRLLILGDGQERRSLEALTAELDIEMMFAGSRPMSLNFSLGWTFM